MLVQFKLNIAVMAVLLAAVGACLMRTSAIAEREFQERVKTLFPDADDVPGWNVRLRRVAESIEMERVTKELLEFDDCEYVDYERGDTRISVYAAYWKPGKIDSRWVASHTPDVCWAAQGWTCRFRACRALPHRFDCDKTVSLEYRLFELGTQSEYVVFCHFAGGRAITYNGIGLAPRRGEILASFLRTGKLEKRDDEQLFIRISSNEPLTNLEDIAPVRAFLSAICVSYLKRSH